MEFRFSQIFAAMLVCLAFAVGSRVPHKTSQQRRYSCQPRRECRAGRAAVSGAGIEADGAAAPAGDKRQPRRNLQASPGAGGATYRKLCPLGTGPADSDQLAASSTSGGAQLEQRVQHLAEDEQLLSERWTSSTRRRWRALQSIGYAFRGSCSSICSVIAVIPTIRTFPPG